MSATPSPWPSSESELSSDSGAGTVGSVVVVGSAAMEVGSVIVAVVLVVVSGAVVEVDGAAQVGSHFGTQVDRRLQNSLPLPQFPNRERHSPQAHGSPSQTGGS